MVVTSVTVTGSRPAIDAVGQGGRRLGEHSVHPCGAVRVGGHLCDDVHGPRRHRAAAYRRLTEHGRAGDSDPVQAADAIRKELLELGSATLGESGGRVMRSRVKPAWPGARLAAPAVPVRCTPGADLRSTWPWPRRPETTFSSSTWVTWPNAGTGRGLTTGAESRGLSGLVIDGGVRDVDAIAAHGFPVFSVAIALRGATKQSPGTVGVPVVVGGVPVAAGDWVVAGCGRGDGHSRSGALECSRSRSGEGAKEEGMLEALRSGTTTMELLDLDPGPVQVVD